ncbi:Hypothetical protein SCF082_LOCUS30102 [Durusdinium trenchii]|uniref:Uncharacterized protein n=1 Tax=Durusdinium trenchii TaxID=1381693 RepID=A0ABP0MWA7_9DINO
MGRGHAPEKPISRPGHSETEVAGDLHRPGFDGNPGFEAWRQLGDKAAPLLQAAPFLNKPLDMAKGWFQPA